MKASIYLHWPFCAKKCHYCDLNSHVDPTHEGRRYIDAMIKELAFYKQQYPNYYIETIFIGGGTPSLMKVEWVRELLEEISNLWDVAEDAEITMEANPASSADLIGFKAAGVNRISFGVQAFQDRILEFLGRDHTVQEALTVIENAKVIFPRLSIDLIYGIPGQTIQDIRENVEYIKKLQLKHVSMYSLTIEPNTLFGRINLQLPHENSFCEIYDFLVEEMPKMGLVQYEISNFAQPGEECRHNLVYWRYGQWLAIGPGACGRMIKDRQRIAIENTKQPRKWLNEIENDQYAKPTLVLDTNEEEFIMKLRIREGLNWEEVRRACIAEIRIDNLVISGDIERTECGIRLTVNGWLKYNSVARYLWSGHVSSI